MSDEELENALDGLFAYDMGSVDSGIHDELLRAKCIGELRERAKDEEKFRLWISRMVRDNYLSEDSLALGYGLEDVAEFIKWLSDDMEFDF